MINRYSYIENYLSMKGKLFQQQKKTLLILYHLSEFEVTVTLEMIAIKFLIDTYM